MRKLFAALLAVLAAPVIWTWNGVCWIAKRLAPAPIPDVDGAVQDLLDEAQAAPPEPRTAGHIVTDACNALLHGALMPPDIGSVPERVEAWLHGLTQDEKLRLLNCKPKAITAHVEGRARILRMPLVPTEAAYQAQLEAAAQAAADDAEQRAHVLSILNELTDDEPKVRRTA